MIREVTATGRDVSSAIDNGCTELGIDRENAQFEIISLPKKGFLGLKTYPAKVRVFEELPDLPKAATPKPTPKTTPVEQPRPVEQRVPTVAQPPKPKVTPGNGQPKQATEPGRPAVERVPRPSPVPRPVTTATPPPTEKKQQEHEATVPQAEIIPTPELKEKVERAAVYLADIMHAMGFETIEVTPAYYSENICLRLSGAQLGVVIGRRGETLDALQYLTSLVANRGEGDYIRVNIDSGNYREKREKTLTALARKLALQAVRTGKSTTLEPMNPYERRVIHGAVSQIRGAVSTSVGADPNRRVVISATDTAKKAGETQTEGGRSKVGDRRDHSGRDNHGGKDSRPAKASNAPRTPLRPNTNTAESVAAAKNPSIPALQTQTEPSVEQTPTKVEQAALSVHHIPDLQKTPTPPAVPAKKLSDAERFGDIPMGVPIVSGDHSSAPKVQEKKPEIRPAPKKIEGTLYGKIE